MKRRQFLRSASLMAGIPAALAAQSSRRASGSGQQQGLQPLDGGKIGNTPAMKITDIKTFLVGRRPELDLCKICRSIRASMVLAKRTRLASTKQP